MADLQVGKRYAQAAFELARESDAVARWRSDLDDIAGLLAESELSAHPGVLDVSPNGAGNTPGGAPPIEPGNITPGNNASRCSTAYWRCNRSC